MPVKPPPDRETPGRLQVLVFHLKTRALQCRRVWRELGKAPPLHRKDADLATAPAIGGGLCQISGLLYQPALAAGLEIVERRAHSRTIAGSAAERNLDEAKLHHPESTTLGDFRAVLHPSAPSSCAVA